MIKIEKTDFAEIDSLRMDYLNSLSEFQELYLEMMVENSACYTIIGNGISVGYAILTMDNILVEFYLIEEFIHHSDDYFKTLIHELSVSKIYCKSFDYLLLTCCLRNSFGYTLEGTLFRNYIETNAFPVDDLTIRYADYTDYPFLLQQKDELYETPQELETFVKGHNIIMFHKNNQLLGCGYLIKIHPNWNYYDIGMWVNTDFRKQGVATRIISYLKDTCLKNNWRPICGCAIDNVASKKTLEKNGFRSKHSLIKFDTNKTTISN